MISPVIAFTVKYCKVFLFLSSTFSSLYSPSFLFVCLLVLRYLGSIFRKTGESKMLTNFSRNAFLIFFSCTAVPKVHTLLNTCQYSPQFKSVSHVVRDKEEITWGISDHLYQEQ